MGRVLVGCGIEPMSAPCEQIESRQAWLLAATRRPPGDRAVPPARLPSEAIERIDVGSALREERLEDGRDIIARWRRQAG